MTNVEDQKTIHKYEIKYKNTNEFHQQKKCHIDDIKNTNPNGKFDNLTQKTNSCNEIFKKNTKWKNKKPPKKMPPMTQWHRRQKTKRQKTKRQKMSTMIEMRQLEKKPKDWKNAYNDTMTIKDKRNKLEDQWKKCLQWDNDTKNTKKTTTNYTWHKGKKGKKPT